MRRPIFGNGFPKPLPNEIDPITDPDLALQVFDLRDLPQDVQSRVFFITLYAYFVNQTVPGTSVAVAQQNNSDTPFYVGAALPAAVPPLFATTKPVKILDRFPMRGPQRLVVAQPSPEPSKVLVWGYVELEEPGLPEPQGVRPLQPTPIPVTPFFGGSIVSDGVEPAVLHQLSAGYIDELTLTFDGVTPGGVFLQLGVEIISLVPFLTVDEGITSPIVLFDGIPMRSALPLVASGPGTFGGFFKRS